MGCQMTKSVLEPNLSNESSIIFVLGKPGCGKGTLCTNLCQQLQITFFSAGELLRQEVSVNKGSEIANLIESDMKAGRIVKPDITVRLLKNAMSQHPNTKLFMIDGFPREMGQYEYIEKQIDTQRCYLLHMKCTDDLCYQRIENRKSGRIDDTKETITNRINHFNAETTQVIKLFKSKNRLIEIDSTKTREETCQQAQKAMKDANLIPK